MYSFDSRIRYSEVDDKRRLNLGSLINYFQDCSTFQSEDLGLGLAFVMAQKKAWVLSAWQVEIERLPELGEKVRICTIPYEIKGFYGLRNFWMETEDGEKVAVANSVWVYMDMEAGRPVRAPKEMIDAYGMDERLPMNYESRKVPSPQNGEICAPVKVLRHHIDTNGHMNNEQYIQMALDVLTENGLSRNVRHMRAEYKKSAMLGDVIVPILANENDRVYVDLRAENGDVFTTVEFGW